MKRLLALSLLALTLAGCESEEEKRAKWQAFCTANDFTPKQCSVLYALKQSSDEATASANTAAGLAGVSMGLAAGSGGRR